jgi:predicted amidohydrolase YtcJ
MLRLRPSTGFACGIGIIIALALARTRGPEAFADPPADLAVVNAKVLTLDDRSRMAEGVAIRGGRIVAVGSTADVRRLVGQTTKVIDAEGRTVIPGLIDSHVHAVDVARAEAAAPYQELTSVADIQKWVREAAGRAPAGAWVWTPRLFPTRLREHRFPTREELDAATTDRPVVVDCAYAQILNSAALKAAGIERGSPDPAGGTINRTPAGEPTGLLFNAERLLASHRPPLVEKPVDGLAAVIRAYNAVGITSVIERATDRAGYQTYEALARDKRLNVRATVSFRVMSDGSVEDTERFIGSLGVTPGQGDEWLKVGPLKIFADGGILGGSSFMREPYGPSAAALYHINDPQYRGKMTIAPPQLVNIFRTGHKHGWQLATHVTGDAGVDTVLDAVETVDREQPIRTRRFTLIHAYFPNPETAQRAAKLGVVIDTQPAWFYKDADALTEALGEARMRHFIGLRVWKAAGLHIAINTDHMFGLDPITSLNPFFPFLTMQTAVTRRTAGGRVIGPDQAVSTEDALRMMTRDAAYVSFDEARTGSLEVGKLGDLAMLSADPLTTPPERLRDITVLQTIVGGRIVFERHQGNTGAGAK